MANGRRLGEIGLSRLEIHDPQPSVECRNTDIVGMRAAEFMEYRCEF
jgi:hypothetical protein